VQAWCLQGSIRVLQWAQALQRAGPAAVHKASVHREAEAALLLASPLLVLLLLRSTSGHAHVRTLVTDVVSVTYDEGGKPS
jgi:hypothetical protein